MHFFSIFKPVKSKSLFLSKELKLVITEIFACVCSLVKFLIQGPERIYSVEQFHWSVHGSSL